MYTSYGWELTNLLQGQDEEYLLEVLTENYRRLRDVPDHLIVTLLVYSDSKWSFGCSKP